MHETHGSPHWLVTKSHCCTCLGIAYDSQLLLPELRGYDINIRVVADVNLAHRSPHWVWTTTDCTWSGHIYGGIWLPLVTCIPATMLMGDGGPINCLESTPRKTISPRIHTWFTCTLAFCKIRFCHFIDSISRTTFAIKIIMLHHIMADRSCISSVTGHREVGAASKVAQLHLHRTTLRRIGARS